MSPYTPTPTSPPAPASTPAPLTRRDIVWALRALHLAVTNGASLLRAVKEVAELRTGSPAGTALEQAWQRMADGAALSAALGDPVSADVRALLHIGEVSGSLPEALRTAADLVTGGVAGPSDDSIPASCAQHPLPPHVRPIAVLAALVQAGAPLLTALETAAASAAGSVPAAGLLVARTEILGGATMSDGLRAAEVFAAGMDEPGTFPPELIALVAAGEMSGELPRALTSYLTLA